MYNITHNNTAVSTEELGMVVADGRTKANHHFKFRAMGAVTAQLHGSFVARTIPEWNRLPAAAADAVSPTSFHSRFYFYLYYILPTIIYDYNWEAHLLYNKDGLYRFIKR